MYLILISGLAVLFQLSLSASMELRLWEAGPNGKSGPLLKNGATFCPGAFSKTGFSLECVAPPGASGVTFLVNGVFQRREHVRPFMLQGDQGGHIWPWTGYSRGENVVKCIASTGELLKLKLRVRCSKQGPEQKQEKPSQNGPRFGMKPEKQEMRPRMPEIRPEIPEKEKNLPKKTPRSPPVSSGRCTTIPATSFTGSLAKGWEPVNGGIFYKKDDPFEGVVPSTTARVTYTFTPPVTSKYAFVLDMTTSHPTEHNDCFVSIAGGWTLHRFGKMRSASGFTKAYHNLHGRARETYSVDNDPHSFATHTLRKGETVDIVVGARSTKMGIHSLILFPCSGSSCDYTSAQWRAGLAGCK